MITVEGINKTFGDNHVLHDITTTFEKGKVNLIIGQSGQGKSVLTKCVVGLHDPDTGSVIYNGRNFTEMDRKEKVSVRKEIGMLFQGSALFDSMTVEDFCLDRVNLNETNALFPAECSGGMQKRIAIARAISMKPKYLFCDEPNSGLDPKTAIIIDNLIREITYEYDITTVVITHDMNSVIEIGDTILFIHNGRNWWEGDRTSIIKTDNPEILDFVYASDFMKEIRASMRASRS